MEAAKAAVIGTTSTWPPSIAVVAAPPEGKIPVRIFRISTPAAFKALATPWWLGLPMLVAMPKLSAAGSFFRRSTMSRPVLSGDSGFTVTEMYSPKRNATGVNSV